MAKKIHAKKLIVVRKKSPNYALFAALIVVALLLAVGGRYYYNTHSGMLSGFSPIKSDKVVAVVNERQLTESQVDGVYARLAKKYPNISRDDALQQKIDETLLLEEADRQEIIVPAGYGEKLIESFKSSMNMTDANVTAYWKSQGVSQEEAPGILADQQRINLLLNKTILSQIDVSMDEVALYRNAFSKEMGRQGNSTMVYQPTDSEIKQAIYMQRVKKVLDIYMTQLRNSAKIEIMK